jgi:hypothetical protein
MLTRVILGVSVVGLLVLGVFPNWAHQMAQQGLPRVEDASLVGLSPTPARRSR